jgi:hypothetical protein
MILGPFIWALVILLIVRFTAIDADTNALVIWATTSLGLLLSTLIVLWGEGNKFSRTIERVEERYKGAIGAIETDVRRYVETSILFKNSSDEMRRLLLEDLEKFAKSSTDHMIDILGADHLRPTIERFQALQDDVRTRRPDFPASEKLLYDYGLIFNTILAGGSPKTLRRFIYLFKSEELRVRTPNFQESYLKWLRDQASWLRTNPKYTITSTPRAPVWGAPKSIIFFGNTLAEVFFKGGGIIITSRSGSQDSMVAQTRKSLVDGYVDEGPDKGGPESEIYTQARVADFEVYIDDLQNDLKRPRGLP